MADPVIRFDDGAAYEKFMGIWSRMAGDVFIDWLKPAQGLTWVDPSEGQLSFARTRPAARLAKFHQGDAMALPFADKMFDAAVMALVIFFVPEPAKGVAELARVTKPGGLVATYAWDIMGGGFPMEPVQAVLREMGEKLVLPPQAPASRVEALRDLWNGAGLEAVETREITVQRTFADFDEFWEIALLGNSVSPILARMTPAAAEAVKAESRKRLPADSSGRITYSARANAIKGRVPK